jgi:hypothetical protein
MNFWGHLMIPSVRKRRGLMAAKKTMPGVNARQTLSLFPVYILSNIAEKQPSQQAASRERRKMGVNCPNFFERDRAEKRYPARG